MDRSANEAAFERLAEGFLAGWLERAPVHATEVGEHRYDGRWPDLSAAGEAEERAFLAATRRDLAAIPPEELGEQARVDHELLGGVLRGRLFHLDEQRDLETDPLAYTQLVGDGLDPLLTRDFASREARMASLGARLAGVPTLVAAAKARLGRPARVFTETAIQQNQGLIALCEGELAGEPSAAVAAAALRELQAFFEGELLARSDGDFRLGRARFEAKLRLTLDDAVDLDEVAAGARALLARTQEEMAETAAELWPTLLPDEPLPPAETAAERRARVRRVLDVLAADHPTNATIVAESRAILAEATRFVKELDLVRVPDAPCEVIEMPEYRRGVAVAYCDASGPLEATPQTFFAIAPTPADWPEARVASFYREYNRSMLADLAVHEAMPGHFLQLAHNNAFPSKLRAVFSSGSFVEGWAVYTEWLMAKHGFGGPKVRMMRQKMVLRLAVNAILDHGVHAGALDEQAALGLMKDEAFQEEGEAVGKWRRAQLSSAQLTTYYHGFTEMMKLREEHETRAGFTERGYHERLLGHGSPSPRALRGLMQ